MGIHVALNHKTLYRYDRRIELGPQVARLRPAPHSRTPILSYSMRVEPAEHFVNWQLDPFGNYLSRLVFPSKTDRFEVEVDLVAEMIVINPFDFFLEPECENYPFDYSPSLKKDLGPYLERTPPGPLLEKYLKSIQRGPKQSIDFLVEMNQRVRGDVNYLIRMEPNVQSCEQTLQKGSGSCRDSAWLLVNVLRNLGLAARFVSGYLIQIAPDVKALDGPTGPTEDIVDLHAWAEAFLPGAGWVGMDATSGLFAGEGHIPLACSPDPVGAAPIEGALEECEVRFEHAMSVDRIVEAPRSTKPYSDAVWNRVLALGDRVEEKLQSMDVRLTMGGEPTFVSIDDLDGAEWNTDAVGPAKRERAEILIKELRAKWAPGGFLHYGQGKWYPGEPLPRWALSCYWRTDGEPIWSDDSLISDVGQDDGIGPEEARRFIHALAETLGVDSQFIRESYEDLFYYLLKERRLPINVDPTDPKLKDPEERSRMAEVFERGLGEPAGFVLPLRYGSWISGPWPVRGENLFLLPGDSPAGLRLPLDSLPWTDKESPDDAYTPLDPFAERAALRNLQQESRLMFAQRLQQATASVGGAPVEAPDLASVDAPGPAVDSEADSDVSPDEIVRTALCVQPRDGRLHLFMPPIDKLEGYLELVTAIEATAAHLGHPVAIEGYAPPDDPRLNVLKVTPDPGVIEVNIQPLHNWREIVDRTEELYDTARQTRLGTEKFLLDGRHTGTGGGNHVTLGGAQAADSPFLRRPDLLRSLLAFWNNHPSLSYLFSGLFIGPTSQQPRIDEARHDSLYELEIAFAELDRISASGSETPPWLVDRLFRHLLVDVSGNTHRAEFCIDKLFSPDSAAGRLGLVELRAFEMPPHARMSAAQMLLIRALIAWFWREPYRENPIRWGTQLHDRFLLPQAVEDDLADVLALLREAGFEFDLEMFRPHLEFRFPIYGRVSYRGVEIEVRQALEPWHVLGEEPGAAGTVRFVDSSVERLQVKVGGLTGPRYCLVCNGRRVPLHPTSIANQYVAGIRFRAWRPPNCLHPTIEPHAPLTIDLFDAWTGRTVGGCSYFVGHPGGRNFETSPVNANEAEGRRHARFAPMGHTPRKAEDPPPPEPNPWFPYTLDLRR